MEEDYYNKQLNDIAELLFQKEATFLFGAGMSAESIPLTEDLSKHILCEALGLDYEEYKDGTINDQYKEIIEKTVKKFPFETIAEFYLRKNKNARFGKDLREKFAFSKGKISNGHKNLRLLYMMLGNRFPSVLYTTNYDRLIEKVLTDEYASTVTEENIYDLEDNKKAGKISVVHLHGCISNEDSLVRVVDNKSYLKQIGELTSVEFMGSLAKQVLIMIGYSLSDSTIQKMFYKIQDMISTRAALNKKTYVVSPAEGELSNSKSELTIFKDIWELRKCDHIALSADEFFEKLAVRYKKYTIDYVLGDVTKSLKEENKRKVKDKIESLAKNWETIDYEEILHYIYYSLIE